MGMERRTVISMIKAAYNPGSTAIAAINREVIARPTGTSRRVICKEIVGINQKRAEPYIKASNERSADARVRLRPRIANDGSNLNTHPRIESAVSIGSSQAASVRKSVKRQAIRKITFWLLISINNPASTNGKNIHRKGAFIKLSLVN